MKASPDVSYGSLIRPGERDPHAGKVELKNLTAEEVDLIQRCLTGDCYIRVSHGRVEEHDVHKPLPEPEEDPKVGEPWQYSELQPFNFGKTEYGPIPQYGGSSITIQHLCGYEYTAEGYASQARRLKGYGFACMRSKRGRNGQFWEIWYLPGLWMAAGDLGKVLEGNLTLCLTCCSAEGLHESNYEDGGYECWSCISGGKVGKLPKPKNDRDKLDRAIDFLMRNVRFGSMDAANQRVAMTVGD